MSNKMTISKYNNGFSLAEMMVVLLILSIIMAAMAPIMTKRSKTSAGTSSGTSSEIWQWSSTNGGNTDAFFGVNATQTAILGSNAVGSSDPASRLLINTSSNDQSHILFKVAGIEYGSLIMTSNGAIQLGSNNSTLQSCATSVGQYTTTGDFSTAIGNQVVSTGNSSVAVGTECYVEGIGVPVRYTEATGEGSTAIGTAARSTSWGTTALGVASTASGDISTAVGAGTTASGSCSTAMGPAATASGETSIAVGNGATASAVNSIAVGSLANVSAFSSIAIGNDAEASLSAAIAIGGGAKAGEADTIAIGYGAQALREYSSAIGYNAKTSSPFSTAIGFGTNVSSVKEIKLGADTTYSVNIPGTLKIGGYSVTRGSTYWTVSDIRQKNIHNLNQDGLDKIRKLKIYDFTFKKDKEKTPKVGVIAQDLKKVFPHAVIKGQDGYLMIRQEDIFYAMINAIKELDKSVQKIVNKIKIIDDVICAMMKIQYAQSIKISNLEATNKQLQLRLLKLEKESR